MEEFTEKKQGKINKIRIDIYNVDDFRNLMYAESEKTGISSRAQESFKERITIFGGAEIHSQHEFYLSKEIAEIIERCKGSYENLKHNDLIFLDKKLNPLKTALLNSQQRMYLGHLVYLFSSVLLDHYVTKGVDAHQIGYKRIHLQKMMVHFDKKQLNKEKWALEHLNKFLKNLTEKHHPFGLTQLNENWEIVGVQYGNIDAYKKNRLARKKKGVNEVKINEKIKTEQADVYLTANNIFINQQEEEKIDKEINKDDSEILRCVSLIDSFNPKFEETRYQEKYKPYYFRTPLSLVEKMFPKEWKEQKNTISSYGNIFGVEQDNDVDLGFYLKLNKSGISKSELFQELDETLFVKVIAHLDASNNFELEILKELLLKERFFLTIFKKTTYNLESLIKDNVYPSPKKELLLYRFLGNYFSSQSNPELNDIRKMRNYYQKCINLLKQESDNVLTAFFIEYAIKEERLGNEDEAIKWYEYIIQNFNRTNSTARFKLASHYFSSGDFDKGLEYLLAKVKVNEEEMLFFQNPEFLKKLTDLIMTTQKRGDIPEVIKLQKMASNLGNNLSRTGYKEEAEKLFTYFSDKLGNLSFLSALIRHYIHNDPELAREEIRKLDSVKDYSEINKIQLTIEFLSVDMNPKSAIEYGNEFIEKNKDNNTINLDVVYFSIGCVYVRIEKFHSARYWFRKIKENWIYGKTQYLKTLLKTNDKNALKQIRTFFRRNPDATQMYLIISYIDLCIKKGLQDEARKFIAQKLINAKAHEYDDKFMSFIFMQQLRLTRDELFIEKILKNALKYAINDEQQSFVYFNYGLHILEKASLKANKNLVNDFVDYNQTNRIEIALENFRTAKELIKNPEEQNRLLFPILYREAHCLTLLGDYTSSLAILNEIETFNPFLLLSLKVYNYIKMTDIPSALSVYDNTENMTLKKRIAFLLASSGVLDDEKTQHLYEISIKNEKGYTHNYHYALFLHKNGKPYLSGQVLSKFKNIKNIPSNILEQYNIEILKDKEQMPYSEIWKFKTIAKSEIQKNQINKKFLFNLNKTINNNQYDSRLHIIKFNYLFKKNEFKQCESLLDWLIHLNFLNQDLIGLFYKLANKYYQLSSKEEKNIERKEQYDKLSAALKYMEYVIYLQKDDFSSNELYCCILYKLGNHKMYSDTFDRFSKNLNQKNRIQFNKAMSLSKQKIKLFIWAERFTDYETKLQFYMIQERWAMIFLGQKNIHDAVSLKILSSILDDEEFHSKNIHFLENRIKRRLAAYYYLKKKDYKKALSYQLDIYNKIEYKGNFVGAFLNTLFLLKKYKAGKEKSEYYIKNNPTQYVYHKHGDFLRELGNYNKAKASYLKSIKLSEDSIFESYSYRGILEIYKTSIEKKKPFYSDKNMMETETDKAYNKIKTLNPLYKKMDEVIDTYRFIKKWCQKIV